MRLVLWSWVIAICITPIPMTALAQTYPPPRSMGPATDEVEAQRYRESALRRFEIVTLVSLPFTTIESFLVVRGVEMARQGKFSPELSDNDYLAVGVLAVSASTFIGFWDWLHTHDKDPSQPKIPKRPLVPGVSLEDYQSSAAGRSDDALTLALVSVRF